MDRAAGMSRLPGAYGFALFLRDAGLDDEAIAVRLGIEPSAARNLLVLAERKLAILIDNHDASGR